MTNILSGVNTKLTGSALAAYISNRFYLDEAPQGVLSPYIVFFIVTSGEEDTFTEKIDDADLQFSLFSESSGATEIVTMYNYLRSLFDKAVLSVGSDSLLRCMYRYTTPVATEGLRHWAVEYTVTVERA